MAIEREYNVPLRREFMKAPKHKRANKATKALREFLAKHMKTDIENVKISKWINQQIWNRGMKKPPHHLKVKVIKDDKGIVNAELSVLPQKAISEKKQEEEKKGKLEEKKKEKAEKKEEVKEEKKEEKEKEVAEEKKEEKEKEKILHKEMPKATQPKITEAKKTFVQRQVMDK